MPPRRRGCPSRTPSDPPIASSGVVVPEPRRDLEPLRLDRIPPLVPEVVHLLRIEGQRGPRADLRRVDRVAAGEGRHGVALGRVREVLAEHVEESGERGSDHVGPHAGDPFARRGVVLGDGGERRRVLGGRRDDPLHLRDGALDDRSEATRRRSRSPRARSPRTPPGSRVARGAAARSGRDARACRSAGPTRCLRARRRARRSGSRRRAGRSGARSPRGSASRSPRGCPSSCGGVTSSAFAVDRGELVEGGTVPGLRQRAALLADVGEAVVVAFVADRRGERSAPVRAALPRSGRRAPVRGRRRSRCAQPSRSGSQEAKRTRAVDLQRRARDEAGVLASRGTRRRVRSRPDRRAVR